MEQIEWWHTVISILFLLFVLVFMYFGTKVQMKEIEQDLRKFRLFKWKGQNRTFVLEPISFWINHEGEYVEVIVTDLREKKQWKEKRLMKDVINRILSYEYVWVQPHEIAQYKQEKEDGIYRFM